MRFWMPLKPRPEQRRSARIRPLNRAYFMLSISLSSGLGLLMTAYLVFLAVTVLHILTSSKRRGRDKTWAMLGVLLLPFAGMLAWWWEVLWSSRSEAAVKRKRGK